MATKRPPLYSMQSGPRRRRRSHRPSILRIAVVVIAATLVGAAAFAVWQVLPLTRTQEGIIPAAALTGVVPTTPSDAQGLAAFSAAGASSRPIPGVHVSAGVIVDSGSGRVLWVHRAHAKRPIASLTKLMTALLAQPAGAPSRARFTITPAMTGALGYTLGLQPGDRVSVRDMLAGALIASANDAANALAVHRGGSIARFVRRMNAEARTLGLHDTHYSNPSGIFDTANNSSAWDQATISLRVLEQPLLRRMVGSKSYTASPTASYVSRNTLLWDYRGAIGIKTGQTTAAGNCIAAAARRKDRSIVVVLLHVDGDEFATAARLLDWGFRHAG